MVLHHFGSKDGLRQACDEYVLDGFSAEGDLGEVLSAATPVRRYLARSLLDGTRSLLDGTVGAAALFDSIVARTESWLAGGEVEGWVRPCSDARARAVTYVSWLLAPLVLGQQVGRLLGGDPAETAVAVRGAVAGLEMLTHGLFTDDRFLSAFSEVHSGR